MVKILLDAGHGGRDGGAAANGIKEKDIVLKLVKKMEALLKNNYSNAEVILSRDSDVYLTLEQRTDKANKENVDVLVSVHCNAAAQTAAKGFESFRYPSADSATTALQNVMHQEIMRAMGSGITDRGKKNANFHMLRESRMKAILTENLFVSNTSDASKLKDDDFLDKIAQGHVNGLEKFLGLKRVERPPQPPEDEAPESGKLWKVQVGAYSKKSNAEAVADDLRKLGYRPYVKYE